MTCFKIQNIDFQLFINCFDFIKVIGVSNAFEMPFV